VQLGRWSPPRVMRPTRSLLDQQPVEKALQVVPAAHKRALVLGN
jgi:hypothetical protein